MKTKVKMEERGITLVALIITVIILVILSAVSIAAAYQSKMVDYAVNGTTNYAQESVIENKIMSGTESLIYSTLQKIESIIENKNNSEISIPEEPNREPKVTVNITKDITENESNPNQSSSWIQIEAIAEDEDNEELNVKIYLGTDAAEELGEEDLIESQENVNSRNDYI